MYHLHNTYPDDSYRINLITSKKADAYQDFLMLENNPKNLLKPESPHDMSMRSSLTVNDFIKTAVDMKKDVGLFKEYYLERQLSLFGINQYHDHIPIDTKHDNADFDPYFFKKHVEQLKNQYLHNILTRLDDISNRTYDWDGNMSDAINEQSLLRARTIIPEILMSIMSQHRWVEPYISSDEEGDITVRWSINSKRLYIIISEDEIIYLMVSGKHINAEMTEGRVIRNNTTEVKLEYNKLWKWLISG